MQKLTHHAIFIGSTQTGKTTTAVALAQEQVKYQRTVFFVNTKGDTKFFKFFNARNICLDFAKYILKNEIFGVFEIRPELDEDDLLNQLEPFFKYILRYKRDNPEHEVVLFIDEIHMFQSKMSVSNILKNLWTMGLGLSLFCVGISQRPTQIHNTLWTQSEIFYLHALNQKDLKYLYENRYLNIPDSWLLPLSEHGCEYPFGGEGISHRLFVQTNPTKPLQEIPLGKPNY